MMEDCLNVGENDGSLMMRRRKSDSVVVFFLVHFLDQ